MHLDGQILFAPMLIYSKLHIIYFVARLAITNTKYVAVFPSPVFSDGEYIYRLSLILGDALLALLKFNIHINT